MPRGGKRPGTGAPKDSFNGVRSGNHSSSMLRPPRRSLNHPAKNAPPPSGSRAPRENKKWQNEIPTSQTRCLTPRHLVKGATSFNLDARTDFIAIGAKPPSAPAPSRGSTANPSIRP